MIDEMLQHVHAVFPVFAGIWILTILFTIFRPQRYLNSILLMAALMVTMIFIAGLFGQEGGIIFLLVSFLLTVLLLFLAPVLLIVNGVVMIRKESLCPAHLLSLGLGIAVAVGEIATVIYVLSMAGVITLGGGDRWVMLISVTVFYFSSLILSFVVYSVFIQIMPHRMDFDYVIIHGCGLAGGERLTKLLSDRVDKAVRIYEKCVKRGKTPFIIPSGGQGPDEKISEAAAMKGYLVAHGIPEDRILPEERSATTKENLAFSKAIIDAREGGKKTALVSSNYHVYRCLLFAREVGLTCTGIGADVALYFWPSALIREFIAVFLTKKFLFFSILGYLAVISPILYSMIG